ncbi:MAG: hypothetical protein RTU30_13270 [Candidatus Thorarchaeota archaeon]
MNYSDETVAKYTLRTAGALQEMRDSWVRKLDRYFEQIEELVQGEWFDARDLLGIIRESRMATREALDGLSSELSTEVIHSSNGIISRFTAERASLFEEIKDLRSSYSRAVSGDDHSKRRENETLYQAIKLVPEYRLLSVIQVRKRATYSELSESENQKKGTIRKLAKILAERGYIYINKNTRPHTVEFLYAPWIAHEEYGCVQESDCTPINHLSPNQT